MAELAEEHKGTVPLRDDMTDFANAILRIQFVHDLNVTDVSPKVFSYCSPVDARKI